MKTATGTTWAYDLVSLGEPLLRFSPARGELIAAASRMDVTAAGSQYNVAANLAALGWRTRLLTKLPDNGLGGIIRRAASSHGVDLSAAHWLEKAKMGATYVEFSAAPRPAECIYDRAGSAASAIGPADFDWETLLTGARFAFTDGIFTGLSPSCRAAAERCLDTAREKGCATVFDINYREHLWTPGAAREAFSAILGKVDILVTNRDVSERVFGYRGDDGELLRRYRDTFGCRLVCMTWRRMDGSARGRWRAKALAEDVIAEDESPEFEIVDRFGTGDAWVSGFLFGLDGGVPHALASGNALVALAHTVFGDVPGIGAQQLEEFLKGENHGQLRR